MYRKNQIKKVLFIFFICYLVCGCTRKNVLEGNWETVALIKDGIQQEICKSNISFTAGENFYEVKGLAGVNLYNAYVKDHGKSIESFGMVNTGFRGTAAIMEYEDMFFDAFLNSDYYKIKNDFLYFYNYEKKLELQLSKMKEKSD